MIIYHPAYDIYHCSYRLLNILNSVDGNQLSKEILKFIDFFYVYPHLLKSIESLPRPLNYHKNKIDKIDDPFEITPNPKSLFFDLAQTQDSAITSLRYKSLVSQEKNQIKLNLDMIPKPLTDTFGSDDFNKTEIFDILVRVFPKINLNGINGFKAKSGLMEFRYG